MGLNPGSPQVMGILSPRYGGPKFVCHLNPSATGLEGTTKNWNNSSGSPSWEYDGKRELQRSWRELVQQPLKQCCRSVCCTWAGHVICMADQCLLKQIIYWELSKGKRCHGQPKVVFVEEHVLRAEQGEEVPWPTKGCLYSIYEVDWLLNKKQSINFKSAAKTT